MTKQKKKIPVNRLLGIGVGFRVLALFLLLIAAFVPASDAEAYGVSGVVSFAYQDYQTKVGDQRSSSQSFSQNYALALNNYLWDPRFMVFTANIGYSIISPLNTGGGDSTTLSYGLNTTFFPRKKISLDAFANKAVNKIESGSNIAGYDVTSSSYGANLKMSLSTMGRNGNRNNNNNNNFGGNGGRHAVLPDLQLSYVHTESESQNALILINESRDDSRALITYRPSPRLDISLDGALEQYKNESSGFSYDTITAGMRANSAISSRTNLSLSGRVSDRTTNGNTGYDTKLTTYSYGMALNTTESARLSHQYQFDHSTQQSDSMEVTSDRARAGVNYMLIPELRVHSSLSYESAENRSKATAVTSAQTTEQKNGAFSAGASYNKTYTPDFLGPFSFNTSYGFDYGFSEISSTDPAIAQGRGRFYANTAGAGFASRGWDKETFSLGYGYSNKRDHSPANNDTMNQNFNLSLTTRRLPRTTIAASVNYAVQESSSAFTITSITQSQTNQQRRTTRYNINASHAATQSLSFNAGATRGLSTYNTVYTLSTLSVPPGSAISDEISAYVGADFNYSFTRNVLFRANAQEELRSTDNGFTETDTRTHSAKIYIDYRMRMIFLNLEYRWKQDVPENGPSITQQYFIARLTRPF